MSGRFTPPCLLHRFTRWGGAAALFPVCRPSGPTRLVWLCLFAVTFKHKRRAATFQLHAAKVSARAAKSDPRLVVRVLDRRVFELHGDSTLCLMAFAQEIMSDPFPAFEGFAPDDAPQPKVGFLLPTVLQIKDKDRSEDVAFVVDLSPRKLSRVTRVPSPGCGSVYK